MILPVSTAAGDICIRPAQSVIDLRVSCFVKWISIDTSKFKSANRLFTLALHRSQLVDAKSTYLSPGSACKFVGDTELKDALAC